MFDLERMYGVMRKRGVEWCEYSRGVMIHILGWEEDLYRRMKLLVVSSSSLPFVIMMWSVLALIRGGRSNEVYHGPTHSIDESTIFTRHLS